MATEIMKMQGLPFCMFLSLILNEIGLCIERGCHGTDEVCAKCKCSEVNTVVNCEGLQLTEIPHQLPRNLRTLILAYNHINSLDENSLSNCSNLQNLTMTWNNISNLPLNIFRDAPIRYLYLEFNKMDLSINTEVLLPLNQTLIYLDVFSIYKISHRVFNNLYKLESLSVDRNLVDGFGESFSTLKNLNLLKIHPDLNKLTNSTFTSFQKTSLKKLILLGKVKEIENGTFRHFKALKHLELHYSQLRIANVSHLLNSVSHGLESFTLFGLYDLVEPVDELSEEFFKIMSMKKNLKMLQMNENNIYKISSKMFIYTRSLEYLDFSHNHLQNIDDWPLYVTLLVNMTFANFEAQVRHNLDEAHHENVPAFIYSGNIRRDFKDILPCKFKTNRDSMCILCPRNLEELRLSRSRYMGLYLPVALIFGNCKISKFSYRDNGIEFISNPIVLFRPTSADPVSLDFGDNRMSGLCSDFLKLSIERGLIVGRLILDGNKLAQQLEQDKLGETFGIYSNLTELNLANNNLRVLHRLTFYNLTKLEILNLSSNSLQSLDFDISRLKELKVLDLNHNSFAFFEPGSMSELSSLSHEHGYGWLTLHIEYNSLSCSCDSMDFINWIIENKTKINNFDKITCKYGDAILNLPDLYHLAHGINLSCYYLLPSTIAGAILVLLIISIVIGMVAHKYRWNIRYYLAKRTLKIKQYQRFLNQSQEFVYDAFVSYEMSDRSWIVKELIMNLEIKSSAIRASSTASQQQTYASEDVVEDKRSLHKVDKANESEVVFTLCIHERDFELGNRIEENIVNAIQMSRMTILVVSKHFIKSKWCRLELEMAKMESLERGRNIVVTVLLEPIQETLESLEWFMKQYTYLEWFKCDSESKKVKFWKRMKTALGK